MLSLVLPKGSLERATLDLFDAADLTVRRSSDRDYHASIDDPRIEKVRFLRPQEIPSYIERGLFDLGITGRDWITETGAEVASLGELHYSKATSQPIRVVLAVPQNSPWQSVTDLPEGGPDLHRAARDYRPVPGGQRGQGHGHPVARGYRGQGAGHRGRHRQPDRDRLLAAPQRPAHPRHAAHQLHRAGR